MDALSTTPTDVLSAYPVVLAAIEDIAHLICSDGVHVFVVAANFFPLKEREDKNYRYNDTQNVYKTCNL